MVQQYLRAFSLIAKNSAGDGIDLSEMSVKFAIHHHSYVYPHTADIRIFNLSDETQALFVKEFSTVQVKAGYQGNSGIIFTGDLKQLRTGWDGVESFTDIHAADGDLLHTQAIVNTTLPAGYTQEQVWSTIGGAVAPYNKLGPLSTAPKQTSSPRGKVMYGAARDTINDWAETNQQLVTVDNGILTAMPLLAYKPGDAIVINNKTGMVGAPEQTEQGVSVTCLLNPALQWGSRILLNNADITRNLVDSTKAGLAQQQIIGGPAPVPIPGLSADGMYKVLTVDHVGETRGNAWYSRVICIALDPTNPGAAFAGEQAASDLHVGGLLAEI